MANRPFPSFLIYVDGAGKYRWRYQASGNHKIEADSGEGYETYAACEYGIQLVKQCGSAPIWRTAEAAKGDTRQ